MVETLTPPPSRQRKALRAAMWLAIVALLAGSIAIVMTRAGVDKALVKQQLDQFAADLKQRGRDTGRVMELTYGDIEMAGGITDRHAVVHDPKFLMKPLPERAPPPQAGKPNSVLITSPVLEIYPESSDLSAMKLVLPQPVDVASEEEPAKSLLKLSFNVPWTLDVAQSRSDMVYYLDLHHAMPGETKMTYLHEQQAQGPEDKTPTIVPIYETLILSGKGETSVKYALDGSDLGEGKAEFDDISIAPEKLPDTAIKIGKIRGSWSNRRGDDKMDHASSALTIDAVTAPPEVIPYAPITFAYDVTYQGAASAFSTTAMISPQAALKVKTLALHTKDASLDATVDFTTTPEDILPVGTAHVKITNVHFIEAELLRHQLLNTDGDRLLHDLIEHISGQPYAQAKDIDFDIKRMKGGTSQIGHATFEELFALLLKQKLQQLRPQEAAPVVAVPRPQPPATKTPHASK